MATEVFPPWPPSEPFPESQTDSIGNGQPDFPSGAGDRERGKFRPGAIPATTVVAVSNDDGTAIGASDSSAVDEQTLLLRAIVLGLSIATDTDLLAEVSAA